MTTGMLGTASSYLENIVLGEGGGGGGGGGSPTGSASDTLSLSGLASSGSDIPGSASDTLTLTDRPNVTSSEQPTDTLTLSGTAADVVDRIAAVSDALGLSQTIGENIENAAASDNLGLSDTLLVLGPHYEAAQAELFLVDTASPSDVPVYADATDTLALTDQPGREQDVTVSETLTLTDEPSLSNVAETLSLVDTVTVGKGPPLVSETLTLTDSIVVNQIITLALSDDLGIGQALGYVVQPLIQTCGSLAEYNYMPFVGSADDYPLVYANSIENPTPPPTTAPVLGEAVLTLTYPFTSPTTTLVLRNAQFNNHDRLNFNRINREVRGGTLVVYADSTWPKTQTLQLDVRYLTSAQVASLLTFLVSSLGQEIGLLDHENRLWRGIITNPDTPISQAGRQDRSVQLTFEGQLA